MNELLRLLTDFIGNQMTLGSNKKIFFNGITKNESKKRKSSEEMNGFMSDDTLRSNANTFADNDRFDSINYETPSKRSRIDTEVDTNLTSNLNTNRRTNSLMKFFEKHWNRFKGRDDTNDGNISDNERTVDSSDSGIETMPSSSGCQPNQTNMINERLAISEGLIFNAKSDNRLNNSWFKNLRLKRRHQTYDQLSDKQKYNRLLKRHTSHVNDKFETRKTEVPILIDLTSEKSSVFDNNSMQSSQQLKFKTEAIDNDSKLSLIERIKMKGLHESVTVPKKQEKRNVFSFLCRSSSKKNESSVQHSTPKLFLARSPPKTPEPTEKAVPIPTLPESSKKFNNLVDNKKDYFDSKFVSDLRNSLLNSTEKVERKITNSESFLNDCHNKREADSQSLAHKYQSTITRTELLSFIPFIGYEDKLIEDIEEEEEEEESVSSDFPELTPDMNQAIDAALRPTPPNDVLSEGLSGEICRKDMETLKGLNWLNDEIINFYLSLIVERGKNDNFSTVYAFNTFFYKKLKDNGPQSLKRWTRKVDVFANDFVFIPIHLGMHWCLAVIDFLNKKIEYYDSMGGTNTECVQALKGWLQAESLDKKKCEMPMTEWTLQMAKDIPQQMNGSDCGMFSCKYAEYISRKAKINFSQAHMPYFRRRMVYEILTKQLL